MKVEKKSNHKKITSLRTAPKRITSSNFWERSYTWHIKLKRAAYRNDYNLSSFSTFGLLNDYLITKIN